MTKHFPDSSHFGLVEQLSQLKAASINAKKCGYHVANDEEVAFEFKLFFGRLHM
jgi:hypothetical protein